MHFSLRDFAIHHNELKMHVKVNCIVGRIANHKPMCFFLLEASLNRKHVEKLTREKNATKGLQQHIRWGWDGFYSLKWLMLCFPSQASFGAKIFSIDLILPICRLGCVCPCLIQSFPIVIHGNCPFLIQYFPIVHGNLHIYFYLLIVFYKVL